MVYKRVCDSLCPTNDQTPKPRKAIVIPIVPLTTAAMIEALVLVLKSIRLERIVTCVMDRAWKISIMPMARTRAVSCSLPKKSAISGAEKNKKTYKTRLTAILVRNIVL